MARKRPPEQRMRWLPSYQSISKYIFISQTNIPAWNFVFLNHLQAVILCICWGCGGIIKFFSVSWVLNFDHGGRYPNIIYNLKQYTIIHSIFCQFKCNLFCPSVLSDQHLPVHLRAQCEPWLHKRSQGCKAIYWSCNCQQNICKCCMEQQFMKFWSW